jgi:hypothetical protein
LGPFFLVVYGIKCQLTSLYNESSLEIYPAAAKVLAALLDKLRSASARASHGRLAVVRMMTDVSTKGRQK